MTIRECARANEEVRAAHRDVRREVRLDLNDMEDIPGPSGTNPSPVEAAILTESIENVMQALAPSDRNIASLALQGYSSMEISKMVVNENGTNPAERTIR